MNGNSVCGVARRHGLALQHLFDSRRLARLGPSRLAKRPLFVLVVVAPGPKALPGDEPSTAAKPRRRRRRSEEANIEPEIDGVMVRVGRDADAGTATAMIGALKTGE